MNLKIETDVPNIVQLLQVIQNCGERFMFEGETFQPTHAVFAFDGVRHSITAEFVHIQRVAPLPNLQIETHASGTAIGQLSTTIERCDKSTPGFVCLKFAGHSGACDCVTTQQFDEAMKLVEDHFLYGTTAHAPKGLQIDHLTAAAKEFVLAPGTAQPEGATHVWDTGVIGRYPYLKVNGDGVAVWQLQNGGFWQWIGNTLEDISGVVQPLGVSPKRGPIEQAFQNISTAVNDLRTAFVAAIMVDTPADPTDELGKVWGVLHAAGINSGGELSASEGVKLLAGRFTGELMDAYQALQEDFAKLKAREGAARTLLHDASVSLYAKGMSQHEQPRVAMIAWLEE